MRRLDRVVEELFVLLERFHDQVWVLSLDPLLQMLEDFPVSLVILTHDLRLVCEVGQSQSCHANVADSGQLGPQILVRYERIQQLV